MTSTAPSIVAIDGHDGRLLDLEVSPSWTGPCLAGDVPAVGVAQLHVEGLQGGPVVGVSPNNPARLILLDLGGGVSVAVVVFVLDAPASSTPAELAAPGMPVVESLQFRPATP